jgi:CubicO group peptidase (beta-lactamase class C family)
MINKLLLVLALVLLTDISTAATKIDTQCNYFPTATWRTSTPEEQGIDSVSLARTINELIDKNLGLHSLLIIRNGYMVLDAYFYPFTPDTKHDLASISKSVTSALIGIAIDKGYIKNVNEKMLDFFPDEQIHNLTKEKASITIKDLLTMRSGLRELQYDDPHGEVTLHQMTNSPNWLAYELNLSMKDQPGTHWVYNSEGIYLLSVILSKATNLSALNFAQKYLFSPLGISDVGWPCDRQYRYSSAWGELRMTPHDMAKIGYLYLHNGSWMGEQIISSKWIKDSTQAQVKKVGYGNENYGYLWWVSGDADKTGLYSAVGRGGQNIIIWPEKNLIVVTTGAAHLDPFVGYFSGYISDWLKSDKPLPVNNKGNQLLKDALIKSQKVKQQVVKINLLPKIAKLISGRIFAIQGAKDTKISFTFLKDNKVIYREISPVPNEFHFNIENIPQKYQGAFCLPGVISGYWSSDNTFVFDNNQVGNNHNYHYEITFESEGKKASIKIQEKTENRVEILKANALQQT